MDEVCAGIGSKDRRPEMRAGADARRSIRDAVLARVGDKWSVLVIMLLGAGPRRFNELKRMVGGISQRMLTLTLRGLERDRERRWKSIDEFRNVLLPFVPGRLPAPRRSIRLLAYLIDVLTVALIEKKLGTRGTGRNWNTVLKLAALVGGSAHSR